MIQAVLVKALLLQLHLIQHLLADAMVLVFVVLMHFVVLVLRLVVVLLLALYFLQAAGAAPLVVVHRVVQVGVVRLLTLLLLVHLVRDGGGRSGGDGRGREAVGVCRQVVSPRTAGS